MERISNDRIGCTDIESLTLKRISFYDEYNINKATLDLSFIVKRHEWGEIETNCMIYMHINYRSTVINVKTVSDGYSQYNKLLNILDGLGYYSMREEF